MLIVLDANAWISERLLRSATGAGFLHSVRTLGHRILLPDVTHDEVLAEIIREGENAIKEVRAGLGMIQALVGSRPEIELPSAEQFRTAAERRLAEIGDMLLRTSVSMVHHRKALARVHEHRPPAETTEQFRDSLLWEVLLYELKGQSAVLISNDRDFSERKSRATGLAHSLDAEAGGAVTLHSSLADYLAKVVALVPPMHLALVVDPIAKLVFPIAVDVAQQHSFHLGRHEDSKVSLFATETVDAIAVVFELTFTAQDITFYDGTSVPEAHLMFSGDCILSALTHKISEFHMKRIAATDPIGNSLPFGVTYMSGSAIVGVRHVPYRVRKPLQSDGT